MNADNHGEIIIYQAEDGSTRIKQGKNMNTVNTLIKWPGGKAKEIKYIEHLIPQYERYVEPFFGGGAMFFYLNPRKAIINDISTNLILFYRLVKEQNKDFEKYLRAYDTSFQDLLSACDSRIDDILKVYLDLKSCYISRDNAQERLKNVVDDVAKKAFKHVECELVRDCGALKEQLKFFALDKMERTIKNEEKKPFSDADLKENLITGFASGYYMYFRNVYNSIALNPEQYTDDPYNIANFYFIREYCYGSMFRYNSKGEFNIPYGGMSYNRKDFKGKIDNIFNADVEKLFSGTEISCSDFADFIAEHDLVETDFMFLDPPYDTDFSDYEGKNFTKNDQARLAEALRNTKARFILIIKNTDYIYSLYEKDFNILCFDKTYTYNVRSRNERNVEHLIITNMKL
jgi:DNA adenine methylase